MLITATSALVLIAVDCSRKALLTLLQFFGVFWMPAIGFFSLFSSHSTACEALTGLGVPQEADLDYKPL